MEMKKKREVQQRRRGGKRKEKGRRKKQDGRDRDARRGGARRRSALVATADGEREQPSDAVEDAKHRSGARGMIDRLSALLLALVL